MSTSKTLPTIYAELVAEEQSLLAAVESVNQRTDFRAHARARIELESLRLVMRTFAEDEKVDRTQAEYSPAKVERARGFDGPERSILVSSDDHVLDGHHQWLSKLGGQIPVIRLGAPIQQLLIEVARFPSSGVDESSKGG